MRKFSLFFIIVFFSVDLFYASDKESENIINTTNNTKEKNIINNEENNIINEKKESLKPIKNKTENSKELLEELSNAINGSQLKYPRDSPGKAEVSESEYMTKIDPNGPLQADKFKNLPFFSTYSGDGARFWPVFTCELDYFYFSFFPKEMREKVFDFLKEYDISSQDFKIFLNYRYFSSPIDNGDLESEQFYKKIIFRPHFFLAKDFLDGRLLYNGFNYKETKKQYLGEPSSDLEKEKKEEEKEKNNLNINQEKQKNEEEERKKKEEEEEKKKDKPKIDLKSLKYQLESGFYFPKNTKCIIYKSEYDKEENFSPSKELENKETLENFSPRENLEGSDNYKRFEYIERNRLLSKKVVDKKSEKSSSCCSSCCKCLRSCLTKKKEPSTELTKKEENVIINNNVNDLEQIKRVNLGLELGNKRTGEKSNKMSGEKKDLSLISNKKEVSADEQLHQNVISNNENVLGDEQLHQILGKRRYSPVVDSMVDNFCFHNGLISCFEPAIGKNLEKSDNCFLYFSFVGCPKTTSGNSYIWGKAAMTIHFFFVSDEYYDFALNGGYKSIREALNFAETKKNHSDVVKFLNYISLNK